MFRYPFTAAPLFFASIHTYDAFAVFGIVFRDLEWKTLIFFWRAVPKTQNAPYNPQVQRPRLLCAPPGWRDQPWTLNAFQHHPLYFISDSPYKTTGWRDNDVHA
jgi:hypothetical protein